MANPQTQAVQTGNMVRIKVGGFDVGWARTTNKSQDYGTEDVYVLGSLGPTEQVMQRWSGQITLDEFVIHEAKLGEAVQLINVVPMGPEEALLQGVLDFEVLDDQDNVLLVYERCTPVNWSYNTQAGAMSGQNATFKALNVARGASAYKGSFQGPVGA